MYNLKDIEKILNFKTWDDKKKIDELLRIFKNVKLKTKTNERKNALAKAAKS